MSAVVGIYRLDGRPVCGKELAQMNSALTHRGPDNGGIWCEGSTGLGHRMLWTTEESLQERLPALSTNGQFILTADARLDNRRELLVALDLTGVLEREVSDSVLILAAFEKWREHCPERLLGDFVFVVWDCYQRVLFCARDHFGVKPLYYYYQPGRLFACASEIKALLSIPEVPRRLNETQVGDYLNGITEDKANTFYLNIHRLPPAHSLTVAAIGTQLQSYWSLESTADLRLSSDEEYSDAFHDVFRDAVRCRMRSAFPRGSHLSGGLDSSAVTCMARKLCDRPDAAGWHTFSNVFDDVPECDESSFINAVLAQGGYIPHYVHPDRSSPLADLERVFWHQDEPAIGPNHFLPWELNKAAAQAGVRVVLDGFDGDSTVSHGAFRLAELANSGQWETFAKEAKAVSQHFKVSPIGLLRGYGLKSLENLARRQRWVAFVMTINQLNKGFQLSRRDLIWKYGLGPLIPANLFDEGRKERKSGDRVHPVINSQFAREIGLRDRNHSVNGTQAHHSYTVREDQLRTLTSGLFTSVLEMSDRCAAAFGIEVRHPFMDKRLVEFCLSLPSEQKLKGGWGRIVMRRALHNILPEEVQWRGGKTDMNPNFLRGFLRIDQEAVRQVIGSLSGLIERYIDMGALHTIYQRLVDGRRVKIDDAMIMWKVTTLAYWLRQARFGLSGSLT